MIRCLAAYMSECMKVTLCPITNAVTLSASFWFSFLNSGPWNALVLLCYLSLAGVDCVGIRGADEHWQFSGAPHTSGVLCWARCCCSPCWHVPKWGSVKNVPYLTGLSRLVWHNTKQSVMEQELTLLGLADWGEAGSADFGMLLVLLICHCCSLPECLSIPARELNIFVLCFQYTQHKMGCGEHLTNLY